eukprot:TRINITY_DN21955_c0_g1_i6.p1 TRINITY_DN21955_c0_g1~~TRINITY_DN21955_c0_g1_i6.p1  ORF type:complete len:334 (-),score=84.92 TRINITY_DN21955_c0_g1_i6:109-1110(-)
MRWTLGLAALPLIAVLMAALRKAHPIPPHMQNHPMIYDPQLLSPAETSSLRQLLREMATFPTNGNDLKFYSTRHEHIGEAVPFQDPCPHHFFVPSVDRTQCLLPGRIDIARHYIATGGPVSLREPFATLAGRVQSFGRYHFEFGEYPIVSKLFSSGKFQAAAAAVCPPDKQHLDPFQFNFILQLPGQTVPAHIDGAYFWGATRFQFPQWLLAAMVFSGLWQHRFVDQVQVVAYFHNSTDVPPGERGDFLFYRQADGEAERKVPIPGAGSAIDGSKTVHAADVYRMSAVPPNITTGAQHALVWNPVSYTHLRAHETPEHLVCRLLLEKKKKKRR